MKSGFLEKISKTKLLGKLTKRENKIMKLDMQMETVHRYQ